MPTSSTRFATRKSCTGLRRATSPSDGPLSGITELHEAAGLRRDAQGGERVEEPLRLVDELGSYGGANDQPAPGVVAHDEPVRGDAPDGAGESDFRLLGHA